MPNTNILLSSVFATLCVCVCQLVWSGVAHADSEDRVKHLGSGTAAAVPSANCTAVAEVVANVSGTFTFRRKDGTQSVRFDLEANSRVAQVSPAMRRTPLKDGEWIEYEILGPDGAVIGGTQIFGPDNIEACKQ